MSIGFFLTGFSCLGAFFFINKFALYNGLINFFANLPFCIVPVYSSEIYPTNIRTIGIAMVWMLNRVGGMTTPFICEIFFSFSMYFSYITFCIVSFIGVYICYDLPIETYQRPLDTLIALNPSNKKTKKFNIFFN